MGEQVRPTVRFDFEADPLKPLECCVKELLYWSKFDPEAAFSLKLIGPQGTRYVPPFSDKVLIDLHTRGLLNPGILQYRAQFLRYRIQLMKPVEHFASSPSRPPKFVIYFRNLSTGGMASNGFCTLAAAKSFVDLVLQYLPDEKPKWKGSDQILMGDLQINCNKLEDILEATDKPVELPYPYPSIAARIAGKADTAFIAPPAKAVKTAAKERTRSPKGGPTSASDIAAQLGLSGSVARRILRAEGVAKPYSWTDQADIDRITALFKRKK